MYRVMIHFSISRDYRHTVTCLLCKLDSKLLLSVRNLQGARLVGVTHVTARDVMDARRVVATQAAIEAMQEALAQ